MFVPSLVVILVLLVRKLKRGLKGAGMGQDPPPSVTEPPKTLVAIGIKDVLLRDSIVKIESLSTIK